MGRARKPRAQLPTRSLFHDLQLMALASVESPTFEYAERKARRKFSEIFHTPLKDVEEYDIAYVLLNVYEHMFEAMDQDERAKIAAELTKPKSVEDEETQESYEDDVWAEEEVQRILAEEEKRRAEREEAEARKMAEVLPESKNLTFEDMSPEE